jgi:hypothetical protein
MLEGGQRLHLSIDPAWIQLEPIRMSPFAFRSCGRRGYIAAAISSRSVRSTNGE